VPKPILSLEALRLHRAPIYDDNDNRLVGFEQGSPPEVRGTLYLRDGGTMKLFQQLTSDEADELEALLERVASRILSSMTAALGPEELQEPLPPEG
jgi:hypothetical protein